MGVLCVSEKNRVEIQDFKDWKAGVYLIEAGCGMGKNYFVFNTLFPYAQQNGKRMLVFSNRVALREQQQAQTQEKDIKLITYQSLEHDEYLGTMQDTKDKVRGLMQQVGEYDYIILDEAHYLYQDAPFNKNTETIIELIEKYRSSKIIVLLSATPDLLKKYLRIDPIPENGVVHHLTDDSLDNRIINLSAMTKKDHDRITGNMILQIEKEAGDKNTFARNGKPYPWIEGEFFESNEKAAEFLGTSVKELTAFLRRKPEAVFGNSKAWHWKDGRIIMKSPKLFSDKNTLLYFEN